MSAIDCRDFFTSQVALSGDGVRPRPPPPESYLAERLGSRRGIADRPGRHRRHTLLIMQEFIALTESRREGGFSRAVHLKTDAELSKCTGGGSHLHGFFTIDCKHLH